MALSKIIKMGAKAISDAAKKQDKNKETVRKLKENPPTLSPTDSKSLNRSSKRKPVGSEQIWELRLVIQTLKF